ncbi:MAG: alpha/beta fold hydrolase [Ruminococcaceae bacterium]|nr:alpha/beta fold hydrolase [Oscillospiraceae bacterium]
MDSLKYPVLFVHGMGYRDYKLISYWGRIPRVFEEKGVPVYYGYQDSNADIETNGLHIANRIDEIIKETGAEKLNIIAHSKGGLDCRYAISALGKGDRIASLTTISTPHNGSKTVDLLMKFPKFLVKFAGFCTDCVFRVLGDKKPNSYRVFQAFTTKEAKIFNEKYVNDENVYYQSYAFVMKNAFSDIFMCIPNIAVSIIEGKNDGLLTPDAAKWGDFKGIYTGTGRRGISHCDEVDMRRRRFTKKKGDGVSDILEVYEEIYATLLKLNY